MRNLRSTDLFELKTYKLAATVELEVVSQLRSLQHSTNHAPCIYQMSMYIIACSSYYLTLPFGHVRMYMVHFTSDRHSRYGSVNISTVDAYI
jgi:hypothetical protein